MRRALAAIAALVLLLGTATPAWAAPTTEVVQGRIIRLVSVADWSAAGRMLPGQSVRWDVEVSADAPDPGVVTIGLSATGDARLLVDASLCAEDWRGESCASGAVALRTGWSLPTDGGEIDLTRMKDTDVAHIRLAIALAPGGDGGSTSIRFHARGQGETLTTGPGDDGLATTGMSSSGVLWILLGGAALLLLGLLLIVLRARRQQSDSDDGAVAPADAEPGEGARPHGGADSADRADADGGADGVRGADGGADDEENEASGGRP